MKQLILPIVSSIIVWATVYGFSYESDPSVLLEKKNRETVTECIENLDHFTWSTIELQREAEKCAKIQLRTITWTATGASIPVPPKWYTAKHSLNLSGSHDYRIYPERRWAVWRSNNPSGLTWWVSKELKRLWDESNIKYSKWIARPVNEWWYYVLFLSIEDGLRAKVIAIRERWWKATVGHFLAWWWTDHVDLSFNKWKTISELSEWEFAELFIQQLKKESPWLVSQLVKDWILIIH